MNPTAILVLLSRIFTALLETEAALAQAQERIKELEKHSDNGKVPEEVEVKVSERA